MTVWGRFVHANMGTFVHRAPLCLSPGLHRLAVSAAGAASDYDHQTQTGRAPGEWPPRVALPSSPSVYDAGDVSFLRCSLRLLAPVLGDLDNRIGPLMRS